MVRYLEFLMIILVSETQNHFRIFWIDSNVIHLVKCRCISLPISNLLKATRGPCHGDSWWVTIRCFHWLAMICILPVRRGGGPFLIWWVNYLILLNEGERT